MRQSKIRQRKRGITLVELLTVIVILAVLMAILLPAYNLVRESARRTQCQNNQQQLALAITTYENAKNHLPGYVSYYAPNPNNTTKYPINWVESLMPNLGQNAIWQQVESGTTPTATVGVMICPDDSYLKANPTQCAMSYVVNNNYLYLPQQTGKPPIFSGFLNLQPSFQTTPSPPQDAAGNIVPQTTISKMVSPTATVMLSENVNSSSLTAPWNVPHIGPWNAHTSASDYPYLTFGQAVKPPPTTIPPAPIVSTLLTSGHGSVIVMSFFDGHQQTVNMDAVFPTP